MFAGTLIIFSMSALHGWRWLGVSCWLAMTGVELRDIAAGYKRFTKIRIDDGGVVALQDAGGSWVPARLLHGSIVLPRLAWLRLRAANGCRYGELLRCDPRQSEAWRRLQVLWRHLGGAR
jgi:hypothetical protein